MLCTIHIRYENDRGTLCPEYIALPGEQDQSHPRLWWIEINNPTPQIESWHSALPKKLAAPEVAKAMLALEGVVGVTDPTKGADWIAHGVKIVLSEPAGFVNWPDPDLGKGW